MEEKIFCPALTNVLFFTVVVFELMKKRKPKPTPVLKMQ